MGKKRTIDNDFWKNSTVIDDYSVEDKYFMLYLFTCTNSELLGLYKLPLKIISFETGYTIEVVRTLLDRFENKYEIISYDYDTQEVFVKNYIKKALVSGGQPIYHAFVKTWSAIKSNKLKQDFKKYHLNQNISNETLEKFMAHINYLNLDSNSIDIDNDYDLDYGGSIKASYNETQNSLKKPSIEEVMKYCQERNNGIDAEAFIAFYDSNGWMVGKNKMKNWKSAIITWEKRKEQNPQGYQKIKQQREIGSTKDWYKVEERELSEEEKKEMKDIIKKMGGK